MKNLLFGSILGFFLLVNPCFAVTIMGDGLRSCGAWTKAKEEKASGYVVYRTWVTGFLSGMAVAKSSNLFDRIDADALEYSMNKYCAENPLSSIGAAAFDVFYMVYEKKK
jgi:hypothetical protein